MLTARSEGKKLQAWMVPFSTLRARMTMKAKQEDSYKAFQDEIETLMKAQEAFLVDTHMSICECESLDKASDFFYKNNIFVQATL